MENSSTEETEKSSINSNDDGRRVVRGSNLQGLTELFSDSSRKRLPSREEYRRSILKRYREGGFDRAIIESTSGVGKSIEKRINKAQDDQRVMRDALDNEDRRQDIVLKKYTLIILFIFLLIETFFIFLFAYWQAKGTSCSFGEYLEMVDKGCFQLEEWSFKLLVVATISQITYMCKLAVRHLFPGKKLT